MKRSWLVTKGKHTRLKKLCDMEGKHTQSLRLKRFMLNFSKIYFPETNFRCNTYRKSYHLYMPPPPLIMLYNFFLLTKHVILCLYWKYKTYNNLPLWALKTTVVGNRIIYWPRIKLSERVVREFWISPLTACFNNYYCRTIPYI